MVLLNHEGPCASSASDDLWRRRSRSIALWRAVWMIQARGNSGTPRVAPLVDRGRKRFLGRLFGQIEVAQEPDQRRHDPAPIRPVNGIDRGRGVVDPLGHSRW